MFDPSLVERTHCPVSSYSIGRIMRRANFPIACYVAILYLPSSMPYQAYGRLSLLHVNLCYAIGSLRWYPAYCYDRRSRTGD